jgi:hypothetical protein
MEDQVTGSRYGPQPDRVTENAKNSSTSNEEHRSPLPMLGPFHPKVVEDLRREAGLPPLPPLHPRLRSALRDALLNRGTLE